MPLLNIRTSVPVLMPEQTKSLQLECSQIISEDIGKSLDFVMILIDTNQSIYFASNDDLPAAYLELKNIGTMSPELTNLLANKLCNKVKEVIGVPENRVYIEFQESARHHWGWNGKNFA